MMKCIIIDDEPLAIDLISDYVKKSNRLGLVGSFTNSLKALHALEELQPDVLFLDVQMPELTGIQFLKITKGKYPIVLTTAYTEYAIEGYEHDIIDYLLKPITFERFLITEEKIKKRIAPSSLAQEGNSSTKSPEYIFVKSEYKTLKINLSDILYLEGLSDYVVIHLEGKKHLTLSTLKGFEERLPSDKFIRVHKSFIINFSFINHIERNQIIIGDKRIPIGVTYQKAFIQRLE